MKPDLFTFLIYVKSSILQINSKIQSKDLQELNTEIDTFLKSDTNAWLEQHGTEIPKINTDGKPMAHLFKKLEL